jgi:hypothetical protein
MNKLIIYFYLISLFRLSCLDSIAQSDNWRHEISTNLLQIPSNTIDLEFQLSRKSWYTLIINPGYTINYSTSYDFIGFFLSPHCKCANKGYSMRNQSGPYFKVGIRYNFRRNETRDNYFFIGGLLNNSFVHERAVYNNPDTEIPESDMVEHTQFVYGLTGWTGYNFKIKGRISSDFGLQISIPSKGYNFLYGNQRYIPGFGYTELSGRKIIIPLIVFSFKYSLTTNNTP